jgi:hypothetical protein
MKYEVRQYKAYGQWTNWKEVSKEVAEHKAKVRVKAWVGDDAPYGGYDWCAPYQVRIVEEA